MRFRLQCGLLDLFGVGSNESVRRRHCGEAEVGRLKRTLGVFWFLVFFLRSPGYEEFQTR